jgi:malonyl CoA-acyl carrier protein transacylase/phosphopantetheinyl transferase
VNAFGSGGVNAHVVLEEAQPETRAAVPGHMNRWDSEVVILAAPDRAALLDSAQTVQAYLDRMPDLDEPGFSLLDLAHTVNMQAGQQPSRLAVVATSVADLRDKLAHAISRLEQPKTRQIKDVRGIYFFDQPFYPEGRVAFLFPGEGSQYPNMMADLCQHFPEVRRAYDRIDRIFEGHPRGYLPSDFIFPRPGQGKDSPVARQLWEIDGAVEAVLTSNAAMHALLLKLGIQPDAMVGHSTGEYSALLASGMIQVDEDKFVGHHLLNLNRMYEEVAQDTEVPRAFMLAVAAGSDRLAPLVEQAEGQVFVGMDNCPHQSVLVGQESARTGLTAAMTAQGLIFESLPFDRAYHTPLFQPYSHLFEAFYDQLPLAAPKVTTYSCITAAPFGRDTDAIKSLAMDNWVNRVRFRETILAMYDDGIRIFVEAGARGNLTAFVGDILRGRSHLAVPANIQQRSGITQLNHLVGLLSAQGVPLNLAALYERRRPRPVDLSPEQARLAGKRSKGTLKLASGWAGMEVSPEVAGRLRSRLAGKTSGEAAPAGTTPTVGEPVVTAPAGTRSAVEEPAATTPLTKSKDENTNMQHYLTDTGGEQHAHDGPPVPSNTQPAEGYVDGRAMIMQGHLQLLDQFLRTQEALVQQFLTGVATPASAPVRYQVPIPPAPAVPDRSLALPSSPAQPVPQQIAPPPPEPAPAPQPTPVAPVETPAAAAPAAENLDDLLLRLVSEKTGYPVEVLSLNANLEADLGIDSIKRVEILGAFHQQTGLVDGDTMEHVSSLKTLGAILDFFRPTANPSPSIETGWPTPKPSPTAADPLVRMPFIREVRTHVPGQELDALCTIDAEEDLFLRDHTLGREISRLDPGLLALPIVPLTVTMEILAEAAALLAPGQVLVGMRNLRASRWILLEQDSSTLLVTARRQADSAGSEFDVIVRVLPDVGTIPDDPSSLPAAAQGTMVFAAAYPEPPAVRPLVLRAERPSQWRPDTLYREGMFHGPAFRAVKSIDKIGDDGLVATMEALPTDRFLRSTGDPGFIAEPIILDAAGQLIGFWTLETLERGFVVFPYHLKALHFYGPALQPGQQVTCLVRSTLLENLQMTSDIDIVDEDGRLRLRLEAWDDKRFDIPRHFYRFILNPSGTRLSEPWPTPLTGYANGSDYCSRWIGGFPKGFFQAHYHLWEKVLAYLVLTPAERQIWSTMAGPDKRRSDWLLGRVAAKEALAIYLQQMYNLPLNDADIEISTDEHGRPFGKGDWLAQVERSISLSIAHAGDVAVAVAGPARPGKRMPGIGIDLEPDHRQESSFASVAFTEQENAVLEDLAQSHGDAWALRLWCAKEAVGKALGHGLSGGPHSVVLEHVDLDTGFVYVNLAGSLADRFPDLSGSKIAAYTTHEDGFVVASVLDGVNP